MAVRIHVSAKSEHSAVNLALDNLDLIRGIWNLFENRKHRIVYTYGGNPKPVNKFILGPYHTLHFPNGTLASDSNWWVEPTYKFCIKPYKFSNIDSFKKYESTIRKLLSKSHYEEIIRNAILRYSRALDDPNYNNTFIKLWSIFELLTGSRNINQKTRLKRTAFFYHDYDDALHILGILCEYRNRLVHVGIESSVCKDYVYHLKWFIEQLLSFHIFNKFEFTSFCEACEFLDLPHDKQSLESLAIKVGFAINYLGYK